MDLIVDGWFHERGELWPGQAMSLKVDEVVYHGRSKYQVSEREVLGPYERNLSADI